jgi:hypothetical protein
VPWGYFDGRIERLNFTGLATAVNDRREVVAVLQGANAPAPSWQRAYFYDGRELSELPLYDGVAGPLKRSDSEGSAINSSSWIAGGVAVQKTASAPLLQLAAVFRRGEATMVFDGLGSEHNSRAFDLSERGHVLVMVSMAAFDARSILWDPAIGTWRYVGDETTNVFPIAMTDDDVVLGQVRDAQNRPVAMMCQPGGSWQELGTEANWAPIDINNAGIVIGRTSIDNLDRPWIHYPNGQTKLLPYITDHHTNATSINNAGDIVGGAAADNDTHALWWKQQT